MRIFKTNVGREDGIRTRGTVTHTQPFQGCTLNHSDTSLGKDENKEFDGSTKSQWWFKVQRIGVPTKEEFCGERRKQTSHKQSFKGF